MNSRGISDNCRRPARCGAWTFRLVGAALLAVLALPAAGQDVLSRSHTPRTIDGEGDRTLLVEGPFSLAWETGGDSFAVSVVAAGQEAPAGSGATVLSGSAADDGPAAGGATTGRGNGRIGVGGAERYRVAITASGPWQMTVTW